MRKQESIHKKQTQCLEMKSMNRKVPLFYLLAIIIFMQSFIFGGILLLFWGCLIVGLCYSDILKIYLLSVLAIYIILLPSKTVIKNVGKEWKNNNNIGRSRKLRNWRTGNVISSFRGMKYNLFYSMHKRYRR